MNTILEHQIVSFQGLGGELNMIVCVFSLFFCVFERGVT